MVRFFGCFSFSTSLCTCKIHLKYSIAHAICIRPINVQRQYEHCLSKVCFRSFFSYNFVNKNATRTPVIPIESKFKALAISIFELFLTNNWTINGHLSERYLANFNIYRFITPSLLIRLSPFAPWHFKIISPFFLLDILKNLCSCFKRHFILSKRVVSFIF